MFQFHHHYPDVSTFGISLTLSCYPSLLVISRQRPLNVAKSSYRADECKFCWSANTGVSMCRSPLENIVLTSSAVPSISWMVCEMRSKWPYSCCFVGCCFYDFFKTASLCSSHLDFSLSVS